MNTSTKKQLAQLAKQQQEKSQSRYSIDFNDVAERAYDRVPEILEALNHSYVEGDVEIDMINPNRPDGDFGSFRYNKVTTLWSDFATDDTGKGPIALVMYLEEVTAKAAAKLILDILDGNGPSPTAPNVAGKVAANDSRIVSKPRLKVVKPDTLICPVPADAPAVPESFYQLGKPSHRYVYRSPKGEVLCYILRFPLPDGKKEIRPLTLNRTESGGMAWKMSNLNGPTPLYNLDQMALYPDRAIIIGEGEKSADALAVLFPQFVSTTAIGGAQRPAKADWSPVYGKQVFIWADRDEVGQKYAETIIGILREQDPTARISVLYELTVYSKMDDEGNPVLVPGFVADKGDDAADALALGWTPAHAELLLKEGHFVEVPIIEAEVKPLVKSQRICGPAGDFLLNHAGVNCVRVTDGEEYLTWLSTWIRVIATARNLEDSAWGVMVEYAKPSGILDKEYLSFADLQGTGQVGLTTLSTQGVNTSGNPKNRIALTDYLKIIPVDENNQPQMVRITSKSGWVGPNTFVTPLKVIGNSNQEWVYTGPASNKTIFESKGTLDDWKTNVASKCVGNSRLILPVCVALSGPLQHVIGAENGGIHLRGSSSIGKSVALSVGGSVWSPPSELVTWRATDNALEKLVLARNDTLLTLDEMSQASPEVVGNTAYMLGNGTGKARATSNMTLTKVERFRTQVISTGEVSLEDHIKSGGKRAMAGQEVRFLDIPADAGVGLGLFENVHGASSASAFAEGIRRSTGLYYGTAGMAMVEFLCGDLEKDKEEVIAILNQFQQEFIKTLVPEGAGGQIYRVAARFALYALAGELAIHAGILPWLKGEADRGVAACFNAWLENRGGIESLEKIKALGQIREFLERNGTSRFAPWDQPFYDAVTRTHNQAGLYKTQEGEDGRTFFVFPEVFRSELCRGFDYKLVVKWLIEAGWLATDSNGKAPISATLPELGSKRVYKLLPLALADGQAEVVAPEPESDQGPKIIAAALQSKYAV